MKKKDTSQLFHCIHRTLFDPVVILWSEYNDGPKIRRILLSSPCASAGQLVSSLFPGSISSSSNEIDGIANKIASFFNGENVQFSIDIVCLDQCPDFQEKILRAEYGIPRGRVSTYQRIAKYFKNPNGARAVGTALANNPFPILIPCHRAICSDGTLGGYQGGLEMKQALLTMEGVHFDNNDCVTTKDFFY